MKHGMSVVHMTRVPLGPSQQKNVKRNVGQCAYFRICRFLHVHNLHVAVGEEGSCSTSEGHLCRDDRGERLAVEGRAAQNGGVDSSGG